MSDRNQPHFDKPRTTPEGGWITRCRLLCRLKQSEVASVLKSIDPRFSNQGRPSEFETGKRPVPIAVIKCLHAFFRERLGDACPPPPYGGSDD